MNIARRTHALAICSLIAILLGNLVLPASADDAPAIVADASPAPAGVPGAPAMTPEQIKAAEAAIIKASQNPVGNIAVIPFQNNWNYGFGPYVRTQYNLNIQPVVPIMLTPSLTLIERSIVPLIDQPSPLPPAACATQAGCPWTFGLGDIQEQLYLAPKVKPDSIIWGAGPIFYLPTATPGALGATKTSVGPTAVALIMPGAWVIGILANQAWSVIGPSTAPAVSLFYTQPFANFNFGQGWTLSSAPGISANWTAPGNNKWTVPIGGGITKTFKLGDQPQQLNLSYYGNIVRPVGAPYGTVRFTWSLLFPVKR